MAQPKDLQALTGARCIAAFFVFFHHVPALESSPYTAALYSAVLAEGHLGVSFFFTLSGFIIAHNYHDRLQRLRSIETWHFLRARFAKIYPTHLVTLLASLPLLASSPFGTGDAIDWLLQLTLTQSFSTSRFYSFNWVAWSLSDELFFYAMFPIALVVLRRLTRAWDGALLACALAAVVAFGWLCDGHPAHHWLVYINPVARFGEFFVGICLWRVVRGIDPAAISSARASAFEWGACALVLACVLVHKHVPRSVSLVGLYAPALALVVGALALDRGSLGRLLASPVARYLGHTSFAFYMVHQLVIRALDELCRARDIAPEAHVFGFTLVAFALSQAAASLSYRLIELPAQRWLRPRPVARPVLAPS